MSQSNKILVGIVAGVLAVCCAVVGVVSFTNSDAEATTVPPSSQTTDVAVQQSTTLAPTTTSGVQTTVPTTVPTADLRSQLVGKWADSANMSGYEFFADGSVKMTYVNLAAFNIPIDGKADGVYILEGDKLTIKFSIYTATIENVYTVKIDGKMLSMYNIKEHETSTYTRVDGSAQFVTGTTAPTTTVAPDVNTGLTGTWVNGDATVTYTFAPSGQLTAIICNADGTNCTTSEGIYLSQESSLVIQYTRSGSNVTKSYTYTIIDNTLSLTDESGVITLFTRPDSTQPGQAVSTAEALYGTWADSSNMSGYEFLSDGTVNVKYVDFTIPVLNMPIKTTVPGAYTVNGDEVTVSHSIYGATIKTTYRFSVRDNVLTLVNTEDGNTSTYMKKD